MLNAKDLRGKSKKELEKDLIESRTKLEDIMNDIFKGKEKNLHKANLIKKDIARIKTVLNEQEILKEIKNA